MVDSRPPGPLTRWFERLVDRVAPPSRGPLGDQQVIPVRVDLVSDPNPPTLSAVSPPGGTPVAGSLPADHPFQPIATPLGAAPGALVPQPDWGFNQTVLLRRSDRSTSLVVWTAIGAVLTVVGWAVFAPLSETIAVEGKLQPGSKVKVIQAPVPGVIETVLVKDGESVRKGQDLLRFDLRDARSKLTAAQAIRDRLSNENQIMAASLGEARAKGLTANQRLQLDNQTVDLSSRREMAREDLRASQARVDGLRASLATARNINERFILLSRSGAVSELQVLESRDKVNQLTTQLSAEERNAAKLVAAVTNSQAAPDVQMRARIETNLRQIADLDRQIQLASLQLQYSVLKAPSDGVVSDIDVATGSVVQPTIRLLNVVPGDALEAKVFIPNTAIGFVVPGQRADISLDTYPSSDYGRIPAKLETIGSDALTTDEMTKTLRNSRGGLYYPAILHLQRQSLQARTKAIPLKPGMALTADIHLRERTVISIITAFLSDKKRSLERLR